ncbi:MAG: ATP-binding cassette domain-containing protein [Vicinamibacterales bacterium]
MSSPVIEVTGVKKDYRGLRPLRLQKLTVQAGERVALSGLDAAAAEVFVNLLTGALLPDEGDVKVFGRATAAIADQAEWFASLDRFGIVTPRAVLLDSCTLRQNLALPFTIDFDDLSDDIRARTEELAREVGLPNDLLDAPLEQARPEWRVHLHLAKALAANPELLLLEHPTLGVPAAAIGAFVGALDRVASGRRCTLLIITEDADVARLASVHQKVQPGTGALVNARGWRRWV